MTDQEQVCFITSPHNQAAGQLTAGAESTVTSSISLLHSFSLWNPDPILAHRNQIPERHWVKDLLHS